MLATVFFHVAFCASSISVSIVVIGRDFPKAQYIVLMDLVFQDIVVHASVSSTSACALGAYCFPEVCVFNLIYVH